MRCILLAKGGINMTTTLIFLTLFVVVGAVYYIVGESADKKPIARNLDLSIDGLFKLLGIMTVCAGLVSILPNQAPLSLSTAEARTEHNIESESVELEEVKLEEVESEEVESEEVDDGAESQVTEEASFVEEAISETIESKAIEVETTMSSTDATSIYQDGIFQGEGKGYKGIITMEVEVESGEITRVEVVEHRDDRKWFNRANRVIPGSIIDAQSVDVDTVSGATYTSLGMIEGAEEALSKSRGE